MNCHANHRPGELLMHMHYVGLEKCWVGGNGKRGLSSVRVGPFVPCLAVTVLFVILGWGFLVSIFPIFGLAISLLPMGMQNIKSVAASLVCEFFRGHNADRKFIAETPLSLGETRFKRVPDTGLIKYSLRRND